MHPELPDDIVMRLRAAEQPEIPMRDCAASRMLMSDFWKEWVDFLWHYRRRSRFLFAFMQFGKYAGRYYDPKYTARKVSRMESWIGEAKAEFQEGPMKFFFECAPVLPDKRAKHWRPPGTPLKEIQAASAKKREGIFGPEINELDLLNGLWLAMSLWFDEFKHQKVKFFAVDLGAIVGFAYGKPTPYVRYDIDYVGRQFHAYPVTQAEAQKHRTFSLAEVGWKFAIP